MKAYTLAYIAILMFATDGGLSAQDFDASRDRILTGQVITAEGGTPHGRARVLLYSSLNILLAETTTNASGSYSFFGVLGGDLRVIVKLAGYQDAAGNVTVYPNSKYTSVQRIIISKIEGDTPLLSGTVDAAEAKLGPEAKTNYRLALADLDKHRFAEARDHLRLTVKLEPSFGLAHHLLGTTDSLLGDYAEAQAAFEQAIKLNPRAVDSYVGLGRALNLQSHPAEAIVALDKGLAINRGSPLGLFEKGRAQLLLQDYAGAEKSIRESLSLTPPPPSDSHLILANCYINSHRYPEAIKELKIFLTLDPHSPTASKAKEVLDRLKRSAAVQAPR